MEKLDKKAVVVIYSEAVTYAAHIKECGQDYYEWMVADTFDGRINVLGLEGVPSQQIPCSNGQAGVCPADSP